MPKERRQEICPASATTAPLKLESIGGVSHEHSAVTALRPGQPAIVKTDQGEVNARFVVLAGNAYLGGLVPELGAKSMPCGSQIVATEPLGDELATRLLPRDNCVECVEGSAGGLMCKQTEAKISS